MKPPTSDEVRALRELTGCGMAEAKKALELRENNIEFAVEYIKRVGLAAVMSDKNRFPKWFTHVWLGNLEDK